MHALLLVGLLNAPAAQPQAERLTARQALRAAGGLVGSWRGTGTPRAGTREERERGFWQETIDWQWQFNGKGAWLRADVDKGRHFRRLELRFVPERQLYELQATSAAGQLLTFTGKFDSKRLVLERADVASGQVQRLVFSLLHSNRHLLTYETRGPRQVSFTPVYQIGATRQGVPFANVDKGVECIVSGGQASIAVQHKGNTYYVCCSGCRTAFLDDPEKYVREYEAARKKP